MNISEADYQSYYRGAARNIIVMSHQGVSVQFPASAVRPFVEADGVHGDFIIEMNSQNKLVSLNKLLKN